jgi:hypothetical protein
LGDLQGPTTRARGRARQAGFLGAAIAVAAAGGCSSTVTKAGDAAVPLPACGSTQWAFGKPLPVGDGPYIYLPVQVVYRSGPRCRLDITLTAELTGTADRRVPGGAATGTLRSVIGPGRGDRHTALTSISKTSFLWSNWCHPAGATIRVLVASEGHSLATVVPQRPMCVDSGRPITFTWG